MKLTFENATIADAIAKASRVAPTRGSSFDKANGILITVINGTVSIRATNLEVFYHEVVDTVDVEGEGEWRLGSAILAGFFGKLPIGSGKNITLEDNGSSVIAKSGRTTAKFRMIPPQYFPNWDVFPVDDLQPVEEFAEKIKMVAWAVDDKRTPLTGIHLTGKHAAATNNYRVALVECEIPDLKEPITVPVTIFEPIMKIVGEVRLGVDGGHLLLMPDDQTQIKAVIYGDPYPAIERALTRNQPAEIKFNKEQATSIIDMAMVFSGSNRMPKLSMIVGREELAFMLTEGHQMVGDVISLSGQCIHPRTTINFTPQSLMLAIEASPSEQVIFSYDPENPVTPVRINGGSGYEAWVMPRRELREE